MHTPYGFELTESCRQCALRSDGFFCHLETEPLEDLDRIKYTAAYPKGALLFVEQGTPRGVFILCKGRVKLTVTSAEGKIVILRIAAAGEVLGLHAVVSARLYQASAETLEPCQVVFVKGDKFLRFLRDHGEASIQAAQQLSGSYQTACEQIRSLGLARSASEKLARFLVEFVARGQQTKAGLGVRLTLTHEEIGQLIGTSRETVTRTLGEFKQRRLATLKGSILTIHDKPALEALTSF